MSSWPNVIKKVSSFCAEYELLKPSDRLLIGVSGGPDSVMLVEYLAAMANELDLSCHIAHLNYGQRGANSEQDQVFVETLGASKDWPVSVKRIRAPATGNFQDWARQERYTYFGELCASHHLNKTVLGHHLTDQVETFLLRALRGSGTTGLAAMRPQASFQSQVLIRPLLCLTKTEIVTVLRTEEFRYRHDDSNDSVRYRRNRLRHQVLPILQDIQPNFERALGESLLRMQDDDQLLDDWALQSLDKLRLKKESHASGQISLSRPGLAELPKSLRLRVLRRAIGELTGGPQSITFHHVSKMESLLGGGAQEAQYDLPNGLRYEQGALVVTLKRK